MNEQVNSRFRIILDTFTLPVPQRNMELDSRKTEEEKEAVERMKKHNQRTLEKIRENADR